MKGLMNWLEYSFAPKMNKINHNVWIVTLKDSVNQVMPLIFLGSIFCMLTLPGDFFGLTWFANFWVPYGWTMGVIGLMISFLIPFNLMEKIRLRKSRFIAGMAGLILYAQIITPQLVKDGAVGFGHDSFGAGGMFIAIIAGIIAGLVLKLFGKFSFFKEDSAIPDFVRQWFDQLLPIAIVVVFGWVTTDLLNLDLYLMIQSIFMPLQNILQTYPGFILYAVVECLLYSMGISAWVLTPIMAPVALAAIEENIAGTAQNALTYSFNYAYLAIGGIGCTLGLAVLMNFAKSKKLKALGKAVIAPAIFNINEPLVFGCIAWNPIMMLPFILNGVASVTLAWVFTKVIPFGVVPNISFQLWYMPYPFCTWFATSGSFTSVILMILILAVCTLIYYPFFKVYDRQCLAEESEQNQESEK